MIIISLKEIHYKYYCDIFLCDTGKMHNLNQMVLQLTPVNNI
jgi:hypothetical protein